MRDHGGAEGCAAVAALWSTGLGRVRQVGMFGAGRESSSMIFSRGGRNNSDRCRRMVDQAEIHRKVASGDVGERRKGLVQLCSNFEYLPDKDVAWEDLIRLTGDKDSYVRSRATNKLGSAFQHAPDKDAAWGDLIWLTQSDRRWVVRCWHNIKYWLTGDEDSNVRRGAAYALGIAFQYVPDKDAAWKDLHRLAGDEDNDVRVSANYSRGRASIFGSVLLYV